MMQRYEYDAISQSTALPYVPPQSVYRGGAEYVEPSTSSSGATTSQPESESPPGSFSFTEYDGPEPFKLDPGQGFATVYDTADVKPIQPKTKRKMTTEERRAYKEKYRRRACEKCIKTKARCTHISNSVLAKQALAIPRANYEVASCLPPSRYISEPCEGQVPSWRGGNTFIAGDATSNASAHVDPIITNNPTLNIPITPAMRQENVASSLQTADPEGDYSESRIRHVARYQGALGPFGDSKNEEDDFTEDIETWARKNNRELPKIPSPISKTDTPPYGTLFDDTPTTLNSQYIEFDFDAMFGDPIVDVGAGSTGHQGDVNTNASALRSSFTFDESGQLDNSFTSVDSDTPPRNMNMVNGGKWGHGLKEADLDEEAYFNSSDDDEDGLPNAVSSLFGRLEDFTKGREDNTADGASTYLKRTMDEIDRCASIDPSKANPTKSELSRIANRNGRFEHWIPAYVNEIRIVAFPDNCSALNIISEDFARRNKLEIDRTTQTTLRLPNQKRTESCGSIALKFRFDSETTIFDLLFIVLPTSVYDIVLSSDFLQRTKTFTTFKSRIQRWLIPTLRPRPRVCLQGSPKQQIIGFINAHLVSASPDTGSDVNVISRSFAEFIGLDIITDHEAMETLEFIDGSSMETCGIVYDVEWKFGDEPTPAPVSPAPSRGNAKKKSVPDWEFGSDARPTSTYLCNFYVLENLSCPVILSADLLYGTNAFTACADHFYEHHVSSSKRARDDSDVWVMRKKRRTVKEFFFKSSSSNNQSNSPPAQTSEAVTEARRRLDELDRIAALPPGEQPTALEAERQRKELWDQRHQVQTPPMIVQQGASHTNQPQTIHLPVVQNSTLQAAPFATPEPPATKP